MIPMVLLLSAFTGALANNGVPGGGSGSPCDCDCEGQKKACEDDIKRVKLLCQTTPGNRALCREAEKRGCRAAKIYCDVMCTVDFDRSCDPDPAPPGRRGPRGKVVGDPHIATFDGLRYDIQSVGELVAAVETGDDPSEVQIRMRGVTEATSAVSAVGIRFGETLIQVDERDFGSPDAVRIDGESFGLDEVDGVRRGPVLLQYEAGQLDVIDPERGIVRIDTYDLLDVFVTLDGPTTGLLGNNDGRAFDDVLPPESFVKTGAPLWDYIHGDFADQFRVTDETSLLPYRDGETTATFTDLDAPRERPTIDPKALEEARDACQAAGLTNPDDIEDCAFDIAATGNDEWAARYPGTNYGSVRTIGFDEYPIPVFSVSDATSWDAYDSDLPLSTWEDRYLATCIVSGNAEAFCTCAWGRFEEEADGLESDIVSSAAYAVAYVGLEASSDVITALSTYARIVIGDGSSFEEVSARSEFVNPRYALVSDAAFLLEDRCP